MRSARRPALAASGAERPLSPSCVDERGEAARRLASAIARDQRFARGGDRVRIDVAADLAGDVGLAGQRQHLRAEGRLQASSSAAIAPASVDQRRGEDRLLAAADAAGRRRSAHRVSSVLSACQRLNRSLSWRARNRRSSGVWSTSTASTGAEKPRRSDRTGRVETPVKTTSGVRFGQMDHVVVDRRAVDRREREVRAVAADQPEAERDVHRLLAGWPGVGGIVCSSDSVNVLRAAS